MKKQELNSYQTFCIEQAIEEMTEGQRIKSVDVEISIQELRAFPKMYEMRGGRYFVQFDIIRCTESLEVSVTDSDGKITFYEYDYAS